MPTQKPEQAVRDYLVALKDPSALRDETRLEQLERRLAEATDELQRVRLRQELLDAQTPSLDGYESAFVEHARAWADQHGIGAKAFAAEGVPAAVLRRAGFSVGPSRGRPRGPRSRRRVTSAEVRGAIPRGAFTVKQLQERSGASPAVVRKVIQEELAAGKLGSTGTDPDHRGPGRAPTLYRRA